MTAHDEIRKRIEPLTGGASLELPRRADAPSEARVPGAGQRIRVIRPGEAELVLREGVAFTASGIMVSAADLPDWARNSIMTAALAIRRHEFVNAKLKAQSPAETIEE